MRVSISEARARLAELAQYVMAGPQRIVFIEHRNRGERLVLTTEAHIEALRERARLNQKASAFQLCGSLSTVLNADELAAAIEATRNEQSAAWSQRLDSAADA